MRFLAHSAWPPGAAAQILLAWLTMMRRMRKFTERFFPEAEVVIFGHLHRRAVTGKRGGRLYVNLGACFHHAECWAADVTAEGASPSAAIRLKGMTVRRWFSADRVPQRKEKREGERARV